MPDSLNATERTEVERTIAMAAQNMPLDVQAACSPTFMRAYLRVLSESMWLAGRDSLTARLREVEGELTKCRAAHARPLPLRPLIELQRVQQEDADGCGVAVLAMLTKQTYAEVDAEWPLRLTEHWKDHDVKPHMMMDHLWKRGYALLVVRLRANLPGWSEADGWPPNPFRPFAPMHYAMVGSPTLPAAHWIALDGDGVPFDPFDGSRKTLDAYPTMHEIVGVWPR